MLPHSAALVPRSGSIPRSRRTWTNFSGIREATVRDYSLQGDCPRFGENDPRNVGRPINAHQAALSESLGWRRQLC
jgi:hypothetical protein